MGIIAYAAIWIEGRRVSRCLMSPRGNHATPVVTATTGNGRAPSITIEAPVAPTPELRVNKLTIELTGNTVFDLFEQLCLHDSIAKHIKPEVLPYIQNAARGGSRHSLPIERDTTE